MDVADNKHDRPHMCTEFCS